MDRRLAGIEGVRAYLQNRIDRSTKRIALARKTAAATPRRATRRGGRAAAAPEEAERRAYRDALRALDSIKSGDGGDAAVRMAAEELERVKAALARIYEVTQHGDHDISEAGDWSIVEGEAQTALNVVREAEKAR